MMSMVEAALQRIGSFLSVNKWRNILLIYWLLVPILFYIYLFSFSFSNNSTVREMLLQVPGITIAFLLSCVLLLQAYILYILAFKHKDDQKDLLNKYLFFSLIQQILTGNIIGLVILLFYRAGLKNEKNKQVKNVSKKINLQATTFSPMVIYIFMSIIGFISLLVIIFTAILRFN